MGKHLFALIVMIFSVQMLFAQKSISGTVLSAEDGLGFPSVSVVEKGTANGVSTDLDGKFSINVADDSAVLIFSFIGFVTQEAAVAGKTTVDVSLVSDTELFDDLHSHVHMMLPT